MKRILVTGSKGQLGMTLKELAPKYSDLEFHFTDRETLDITNLEEVHKVFKEIEPEYCINCAAYTQVDQAEKTPEPAYDVNVKGVKHLVQACQQTRTILIHISTDYVFDGTKAEGYFPWDKPNPINVYGKTKLEGEKVIQETLEKYFIVRTSWLYSKKYGHNFYKTILEKAKAGESITVTDQQRGCPTDTENLVRYLLELIQSDSTDYGIKHFTDGEAMTWYEFAVKILIDEGFNDQKKLRKGKNYRTFARRPRVSKLN
ncbi:dTDP-4-dehydrorhamnose reductase [Muriicola jejuensis]|uniref:dTDP-4-dehydrorhamnose reductase n=1 Tax=Muriicola jejuensis TaxID=504488 RepID=A0A6P0U9D3_9FLAO|nr:dTDP-4-dehydrorhamnose reductase [Muriicola jejuensis]NER09911.1 dTDP-4-dehydrorhamnose reductase [Muriicola jejuensis]SMP04840.1 dTDP-4-dehydrorhamnose reductase [Muriicola jejuensis]